MTGLSGLTWRKVHSPSASPETWAPILKSTERAFQLQMGKIISNHDALNRSWSPLTASLHTSPLFWVFCILLIPVFHFNFHQRCLYWCSVYTSAIFYLFRLLRWQHSLLKPVYLTFIYLNAAINSLQLLISGNVQAKPKFSDHYPRFKCNYSMSVQYLTSN